MKKTILTIIVIICLCCQIHAAETDTSIGYYWYWYNYVTMTYKPFDNHPPVKHMRDYIPQDREAQKIYTNLLRQGMNFVDAAFRVIEIYAAKDKEAAK